MNFEFPRRWKARVEIKDLLSDDDSPENAVHIGKAMAERLREKLPTDMLEDFDLEEILEDFDDLDKAGRFALAAFNDTLSHLYDWADEKRVWLGTM